MSDENEGNEDWARRIAEDMHRRIDFENALGRTDSNERIGRTIELTIRALVERADDENWGQIYSRLRDEYHANLTRVREEAHQELTAAEAERKSNPESLAARDRHLIAAQRVAAAEKAVRQMDER